MSSRILMLAGAGSVGKTVMMQALGLELLKHDRQHLVHSSTTRQTYADAGLNNESEALKDPEFNKQFQRKVMSDNSSALIQAAKQLNHRQWLVADRTPWDYASYYTSVFQDDLTLPDIEERRGAADGAIAELLSLSHISGIDVLFLPYPAYWSKDTKSSDGWRADKTGKNFAWSTQCHWMLTASPVLGNRRIRVHHISKFMMDNIPTARAMAFLEKVMQ